MCIFPGVMPDLADHIEPGPNIDHLLLLLTTTGRRSSSPHAVPRQYEGVRERYETDSARGTESDGYRIILANPDFGIHTKSRQFSALGMPIKETDRIKNDLELRSGQHPTMNGITFRAQG